jgi:uncharacterized coiled-coil protein SlyX
MTNQDKIQLLKEQLKHLKEKFGDTGESKPDHLKEKVDESKPGQKMQTLQEA